MKKRLLKRWMPALVMIAGLGLLVSVLPADNHGGKEGKSCPVAAAKEGGKACSAEAKACCGTCGGDKQACPAGKHGQGNGHGARKGKGGMRCPATASNIREALAKVNEAEKAIASGDRKAAEAALQAAREHLSKAHTRVRPAVMNKRCPMMGNAIDPQAVPANLYRQHKGKGVGFCCGGCPKAWDNLSDEQKQTKLDAASGGSSS